jgi:hypothetical protein
MGCTAESERMIMHRYPHRGVACGIAAGAVAPTAMGGVEWAAIPSTTSVEHTEEDGICPYCRGHLMLDDYTGEYMFCETCAAEPDHSLATATAVRSG